MLKIIIFCIVAYLLIAIIIPIILGTIEIAFENFRRRRYILKSANKAIAKAKLWKSDVEYYLKIIKSSGPLTFHFEKSDEIYDYKRMSDLLKKITIYLENYNTYISYVQLNQLDINTPHFDPEYNYNIDSEYDYEKRMDLCISNYAIVTNESKEIRFLEFLHEYRQFS